MTSLETHDNDSFRLLVSSVIDYAIFMLDVNGIVLTWNEGAERITGYSADDIIGQHFSLFYTEQDQLKDHPTKELHHAREHKHYEEEGWRIRKDGSLFWANVVITALFKDSQLVGFAKVTRDLTERRLHEQKLLAAEHKLEAALQVGKIGIMEIDLETGLCSTAFHSVLSDTKAETVDDLLGLILPEEHHYARAMFNVAATSGILDMECRVKIDGETRWLCWRGWKSAGASKFLVTVTDVSERRAQEEKERQLALLAEREDFVSTLAHDMKNPLIGANRLLDLLIEERVGVVQPEQRRLLSCLKESNDGVLQLIYNLIDTYRWESAAYHLRLEETDLKEIAVDLVGQVSAFASHRNVRIDLDVPNGQVLCWCDRGAMRRVLKNLIDNALKFSIEGGCVMVRLAVIAQSVLVSISDNGPGVKKEDQHRLFKRFAQGEAGKRYEGGSGLGLYLCKKIVEGHLGHISFRSTPGVSTTFTVQIPERVSGERGTERIQGLA